MDSLEDKTEDYEFYKVKLLSHLDLEDRILISNLLKENYRDGFLNGLSIKKETIEIIN